MDLTIYAYRMLGSVPLFVVWLIGLALCSKHAKLDRRTCTLTAMALLIAIAMQVAFEQVSTWIFMTYLKNLHELRWRILLDSLSKSMIHAVMWVLILCAIFRMRGAQSPNDA